MIQKLRYILLILAAVIGGESWAQTTSYVCNDATEREVMTSGSSSKTIDYPLSGPGLTLSLDIRDNSSWASGNHEIYLYDVSGNQLGKYTYNAGTSWETKTISNIPLKTTKISIKGTGTLKKLIRNVQVTRATTLSAPSSVNMGEVKIGKSSSAQVNVDYNNTTYPKTPTGSCDNPAFSIESPSMGEYGTAPVTINFAPTTAGTHTGTVTLSMNGVTTSFTVTGTAQDKGTPAFTWNLSQAYINRTYKNFFSSTNADLAYTITSNNPSIAQVVGDELIVGGTGGTATFTVTQEGNEDWHAKTETFSIKVSKPQNHLPLSITESNQAELVNNKAGSYTWDGGIKLGDGGDGIDWDDKIAQIDFQGIPDRISFNYEAGASGATGVAWRVESSSNGNDFKTIWSSSDASGSADIEITDKTSKSVRLVWSGNFGGYFKNIQITELRYLTSSASSIDFGENIEGDAVAAKTFTLKHANAGYGVTVVSSNPEMFEVSPASLTSTGGDKMGEETITVTYKNNTVGSHSGTITISDPNGSNIPISVSVSGTTLSSGLTLDPAQEPDYDVRTYKRVVLQRTLPMGYSTITLPFTYNIGGVEGGYVAQLELVTHNQQDGYTLYFKKVSDGIMHPHQPYVLYLPIEIANLEWGETAVSSPDAQSIQKAGWTMQANYTPGVSMEGKYGIVGGKLCLGGASSTINAYTAYFIPPAEAKGRVRVAMLDNDGTTTYIHSLSDTESDKETTAIYRLDGTRQTVLTNGINIVRMQDGSVRKVLK